MKKISVLILFAVIFLSGCGKTDNQTASEKKSSDEHARKETGQTTENSGGETVEIKLPTVQCGTCKTNITKEFKKVDGINSFDISIEKKIVKVSYDKTKTDADKIEGAIVMAGYQANDKPANKEAYDKLAECCKIGGHD
ncbi:MAG: heavy-metal-associated domain-containing protein [Ignavibacteria bacterium]